MKTRFAFFDIDGTLSAPYYPVGGELKPGMTDDEWITFCAEHGDDSYIYCKPVLPVKRYAEQLRKEGAELFVLSTSQSAQEDSSKERFIERHYPGMFREVLTVRSDEEKVPAIKAAAVRFGVEPEACELIEDTYSNVLKAVCSGIKATHVSQIVCDL